MRWLIAILVAASLGSCVYALGFGAEVAYIVRSIARHFVLTGDR